MTGVRKANQKLSKKQYKRFEPTIRPIQEKKCALCNLRPAFGLTDGFLIKIERVRVDTESTFGNIMRNWVDLGYTGKWICRECFFK